jgi:lipoprotein-releasing system ATP-binding protein
MTGPILSVKELTKEFKQGSVVLKVLKGISLQLYEGEILVIVGPSGAGKTTLLHIMGFLDKPTTGDLIFKDLKLSTLTAKSQARIRNKSFGFIFQMYYLLPELTAIENVLVPVMIQNNIIGWFFKGSKAKKKALRLLERVGLKERVYHKPSELSGGEQQRVAIVRAFIQDPEIIFCDEPTGSLDSKTGKEILDLISELNREDKKTFVIVTHNENITKIATRVLKLEDGRLI